MENTLTQKQVAGLFLITIIGYIIFATNTDPGSFSFRLSRNDSETWALWRYPIVGAWLLLAFLLFIARKKVAYRKSFFHGLLFSGIVALILAGKWIEVSDKMAVLGTAITYTIIAGLLCMTLKHHVWAGILAGVLVIAQILVDIVLLGIAGDIRIH
jgi:hypothetical protein